MQVEYGERFGQTNYIVIQLWRHTHGIVVGCRIPSESVYPMKVINDKLVLLVLVKLNN